MDVILRIPDDLAARLGTADLSRRALEALVIEEYRAGRVTQRDLRELLGLETRAALDGFLQSRDLHQPTSQDRELSGTLVARFSAFRVGKTLGGLPPAALIREGRR